MTDQSTEPDRSHAVVLPLDGRDVTGFRQVVEAELRPDGSVQVLRPAG